MLNYFLGEDNAKSIRSKMSKNDIFKYEMPFEITKKGNRGTVMGFYFSVIYVIIINYYIWSSALPFFNHSMDTYQTHF